MERKEGTTKTFISDDFLKNVFSYKKTVSFLVVFALVIFSITFSNNNTKVSTTSSPTNIDEDAIPNSSLPNNVQEQNEDINVIPDKYNTGTATSTTFTKISANTSYNGVNFSYACNKTKTALDLAYINTSLSGVITIENADFSQVSFCMLNENAVKRDVSVLFKNCKFSSFETSRTNTKVKCSFESCDIKYFSGSNCDFNRCNFGHSVSDSLIPFRDIIVSNCYFSDMSFSSSSSNHTDGTQIYGYSDTEASNIQFNNCRFETPEICPNSASYVNACIMLQLEFNNGTNISFNDCIINGGGYSIYARVTNKNYSLSNISFNNIRVGNSRRYGTLYPDVDPNISFTNVYDTDSLYVSSVWKDNSGTHLIVTNDSSKERILKVTTDKGDFEYTIPAMPSYSVAVENGYKFSDLPIDIEKIIEVNCSYIVCYDVTDQASPKQIRSKTWDDTTNEVISDTSESTIEKSSSTNKIVTNVNNNVDNATSNQNNTNKTSTSNTTSTDKTVSTNKSTAPISDPVVSNATSVPEMTNAPDTTLDSVTIEPNANSDSTEDNASLPDITATLNPTIDSNENTNSTSNPELVNDINNSSSSTNIENSTTTESPTSSKSSTPNMKLEVLIPDEVKSKDVLDEVIEQPSLSRYTSSSIIFNGLLRLFQRFFR